MIYLKGYFPNLMLWRIDQPPPSYHAADKYLQPNGLLTERHTNRCPFRPSRSSTSYTTSSRVSTHFWLYVLVHPCRALPLSNWSFLHFHTPCLEVRPTFLTKEIILQVSLSQSVFQCPVREPSTSSLPRHSSKAYNAIVAATFIHLQIFPPESPPCIVHQLMWSKSGSSTDSCILRSELRD
jgi:hypothetical protein